MKNDFLDFNIVEEDIGERLDKFLSLKLSGTTRSFIQKLIAESNVAVNGKSVNKNYKLRCKDKVTVVFPEPESLEVKAENIPLDIMYEDDDILVVNKAKGMVVHPAAGHSSGTLVNALLYHCKDSLSGINGVLRPGIVHRIDKDTSGLLIVAKNDKAHQSLAQQIKEHSFKREYEAIVYGNFKEKNGLIEAPIGRHQIKRKQMAVFVPNAREAKTLFEVIQEYEGFSDVRLKLFTGRTHQIRVHMAYISHPVAGDEVYGSKKVIKELNGQCLHAKVIGFIHPVTNKYLEFVSDLPSYFINFRNKLKEV